jgi:MinD superfamily P-loop ATPase
MRIAVASGKGGTGKTTVATNLAFVASRNHRTVAYIDCDVEEPNGQIFLKPEITRREPICNPIPQVDAEACTHCGECGKMCRYSAIVCVGEEVLVFAELCHSCGACGLVCPANAITEVPREIAVLEAGRSGDLEFVQGRLNIGEVMSPSAIRAVRRSAPDVSLTIVDSPPGTSCPVIAAVRNNDYVVLVTEPTPFGLNDLKLAVGMVRELKLPFGVVINRCDVGDDEVSSYCLREHIDILAEIPEDRSVAEGYSRGRLVAEDMERYQAIFSMLLDRIYEVTEEVPRSAPRPD